MNKFDVSIVLNIHREALYLRPTLYSLDACAKYAIKNKLKIELVAVFDKSDEETLSVFRETVLESFDSIKIVEVNVGSLGLARNAGIEIAEGEYIWTADADDLVSYNALSQLYETAQRFPDSDVVVFLEYLVAFGQQYHVARYFGSEWLTAADFAYQHSFVSRIFIKRSLLKKFPYKDLKITDGFAYEDWDLNSRLFSEGVMFAIAPNTLFFYRQREGSLLKQANASSVRMIPHSNIFEPIVYKKLMNRARENHSDWQGFLIERQKKYQVNYINTLFSSPLLRDYIADASSLEPEIQPSLIKMAPHYCMIPWSGAHWGFWLEKFYEIIDIYSIYTDIVILPWLHQGGAEKYIIQILNELHSFDSNRKILIVTGESSDKLEWLSMLPKSTAIMDLFNFFPMLDEEDRLIMLVRALLAVSNKKARLHLKCSMFSHQLMEKYGSILSVRFKVVYYRFCDDVYCWNDKILRHNFSLSFLRNQLRNISILISDCYSIVNSDENILSVSKIKSHVIYAKSGDCKRDNILSDVPEKPKFKLLWASRICSQKKPELLSIIAEKLSKFKKNITIDMFGCIEPSCNIDSLPSSHNVNYCGPFSGFSSLPVEQYDAFIYTSAFDGLPNILIEAIANGLPVIAPDVGGISELIIDNETGYLIPNIVNENELAESYSSSIVNMYGNWDGVKIIRDQALNIVNARHGEKNFSKRVKEVFETDSLLGDCK